MAFEGTGRREFAELVTHHVLRDIDRNKLGAVVDGDRVAYEVRGNHAGAGPGLDDFFLHRARVHSEHSFLQGFLDVRTFSK